MGGCADFQRSIHWLLDDELERDDAYELERHVNLCVACRDYLHREMHMRRVLQRVGRSVVAPMGLRERMRGTIASEIRSQDTWRRYWPVMAGAAILMSFVIYSRERPYHHMAHGRPHHQMPRHMRMDVQAAEWQPYQSAEYLRPLQPGMR